LDLKVEVGFWKTLFEKSRVDVLYLI